ncbi:MAG TPA: hypothetical protein ENK44_08495 [Caldithrix abyssi]|uniref:DUF4352 domain-containing protein n=1 Tax=Caldithrix abyssi TaxID=187145 RepID=A0A7V4U0H4_CALAY|nr:hypothetical protein [Caldithrix abyssi]
MKTRYFVILSLFFSLIFWRCGGNPEADGDEAFKQGDYKHAIGFYLQVKKTQPQNSRIDEKIALSYMQYGKKLYDKRRNLKAFVGNFEKGEGFLPEGEHSPEFNKDYSNLLYYLAKAYYETEPANEIQREQYFSKTLDYLDQALLIDMENQAADSLLSSIKQEHFQKMFEKGLGFYKQARKDRNNGDLFLSAEHYLARAVSFNPDHEEAQKYLKKTRKETLSILDYDKPFALAVAATTYKGKTFLIDFTGVNNTGADFTFDPQKLVIIDEGENEYTFDKSLTEKYKNGLTEAVTLKARKRVDGVLVYPLSKKTKLLRLEYEMPDGYVVKKYFP